MRKLGGKNDGDLKRMEREGMEQLERTLFACKLSPNKNIEFHGGFYMKMCVNEFYI